MDIGGRVRVGPDTEEASELKRLADRRGSLASLGHRKHLQKLVDFGLARSSENSEGMVDDKLTDRGNAAVREMMV